MVRKINIENERQFENRKVLEGDVRAAQSKFYWATMLKMDQFNSTVAKLISGKQILEIGCSSGGTAQEYCKSCEHLTGVDVSDEGIKAAKALNLDNAIFEVCDAHHLPFKDGQYDVVIVSSLLHHLDLEVALTEIRRVLKVGGLLLAREPLGTNPVFNFYRLLTPDVRTEDERPFTHGDLKLMNEKFLPTNVVFFGLTSVLTAFIQSTRLRYLLTRFDELLAKTPIKYLCWQFWGVYKKIGTES